MSGLKYGYAKTLMRPSVEDAVVLVSAALVAEGFEVYSQVDVGLALKEELGVEFRRYLILGACNLTLAHEALSHDPHLGLGLLCYVVVQESLEDDRVVVSIVDPMSLLRVGASPVLNSLAEEADQCVRRVIRSLS